MASTLTRRPLSSAVLSEGLFETGEALAAQGLAHDGQAPARTRRRWWEWRS
ncbi:hypothetical protein [Streptomyces demainii]|uniref:Uncharacterized protein n=1 Tax=Streptomyces demainii TaxID=588122 RepID=A0ABT9KLZ0_9ACTN|nr:hypothetical protein [Streptomyces demainii]MDP9609185.1 hypothetical protein [Streptomyces demainii]